MIELIDLSNWKKMKDIRFELHYDYGINISRDGREWRTAVQKWNKEFSTGNRPYYITHSNSLGYKSTTDFEEGKIAILDFISRSRNMEQQAKDAQRGFELLKNRKFDFEKGEVV